ncbi:uncharacterized protein B0I36DRAFT_343428 [Microdochium trichocladiopsis]|uniref:Transcription factor domain-containing protein n=1 Tax=Microdochium trichocladiopsis TaxID=1682393 RepID=A0A9P8YGL9_9PEZI|nr:uncharacterized protein B0I36DRAFT_343428 [Microdochium trichocladiopsis]KAH7039558.1 hypothetical protein B0I36DRAFT_343428 [Microdochium trichocladiopsis]
MTTPGERKQPRQFGARRDGAFATVPIGYLRQLEVEVAAKDRRMSGTAASQGTSDGGSGRNIISPWAPQQDVAEEEEEVEEEEEDADGGALAESSPALDLAQSMHAAASHSPSLTTSSPTQSHRREGHGFQGRMLAHGSGRPLLRPLSDIVISVGEDWMDHYADVYFQHIQPQWSFLEASSWRAAYVAWKRDPDNVESADIFVLLLALAISALACSSFRADCQHSLHANTLYTSAVRGHFVRVSENPSALVRTQASLLMLLYAFHNPSPSAIPGDMMLVLTNCASLANETSIPEASGASGRVQHGLNSNYEHMRRLTIMSSHILNEVVSSAWTFDRFYVFEFLDDTYVSRMTLNRREYGFFEHLFRLRCIQSRIRHNSTKLGQLDQSDPFRKVSRSRLKDELHRWKSSIPMVASASPRDSDPVYHNPVSLSKLYDYSLSILMQEQPYLMGAGDIGQLVESWSETCRTFRISQESDTLMYWTWSSLVYQFRLGIMLLCCYFITVPMMRTPVFYMPETLLGVKSCQRNLMGFSARWPGAAIFLQAYQLLIEAMFDVATLDQVCSDIGVAGGTGAAAVLDAAPPVLPTATTTSAPTARHGAYLLTGDRKATMERVLDELRMQHVHEAVIVLISEMVYKPRAEDVDYDKIQFAPDMSLNGVDLFSF